jgi:CRP-like cAMP-binding protein
VSRSASLGSFALLREFGADERSALEAELETIELRDGDVLFREGEEAAGLVLLASGRLRTESARAGALGEAGPGAAFGALSLVCVGRREVTATADGAGRVLVLRRSSFRRLAEDAPRAACRLAEAIAADLAGLVREQLDAVVAAQVDRPADAE